MKKIVFIFPYDKLSGMEKRYLRLANYIQRNYEYRIKYFITKNAILNATQMDIKLNSDTITIMPWAFGNKIISKLTRLYGTIWLFITLAFYSKNSFVIIATNPSRLVLTLVKLRFFLPKISCLSVGASIDSWYILHKSFYNLKYLHSIDCLAPSIKEQMQQKAKLWGFKFNNLKVAPCSFVSHSVFSKNDEEEEINYNRDIDLLMVGRLKDHQKGLYLLREISELLNDYNIHLVTHDKIEVFTRNMKIYYSNNPNKIYPKAKIFLSLQKNDNYPSQSLLEAASAGCAIIATDVGDTRLLLNEKNSILINSDSKELILAINFLIDNTQLRIKLGKEIRKKVISEHTIEKYSKYFLDNFCN